MERKKMKKRENTKIHQVVWLARKSGERKWELSFLLFVLRNKRMMKTII